MKPDGFGVFPCVLSEAEVVTLGVALATAPLQRSRAGARHLLKCHAVATLAQDSRLLGLASAALGQAVRPFGATLFEKSPQSNWLVVWHQDTALPLRERRLVPVGGRGR